MPMESQPELMCILHVGDADSVNVAKKNRWQLVEEITETVAACKKWLKQTKYDKLLINFPENHHPIFGYRTSCYKNFTAVPKALCSNPSSTEELGCKQTRSESRSQRGSSSGVLVAKCIFCNCIKYNNFKVVTSLDPSAEIKFGWQHESFTMRICYLKLVVMCMEVGLVLQFWRWSTIKPAIKPTWTKSVYLVQTTILS